MRAMVTGGAGFIGSHIVDALIEAGHQVCVVDNLWDKGGGRIENVNSEARFYAMDIRDKSLLSVFERESPEIVYHQAAQHSVRISTDDPILDAQVNILGLLNILQCCVATGVSKIVFASTGATYGTAKTMPITEETPQCPESPYGITKMASEYYLRYWYREYGLRYTIFRYANVYGPRQDSTGEAGVVAIFARKIVDDKPVIIMWDGEQTRDFVYVGDIARANVLAMTSGDSGVYCLGTGISTSINEIYKRLADIVGNDPCRVWMPKTPGDQRHSLFDSCKAQCALGWVPTVPLNKGLAKVVERMRNE